MKIQCPDCKARFKLPDTKIPDDGLKVRCSRCKHVFKAGATAISPSSSSSARPTSPPHRRISGVKAPTLHGQDLFGGGDPFAELAHEDTSSKPPPPRPSRSSRASQRMGAIPAPEPTKVARSASASLDHDAGLDPFSMADPFEQTRLPNASQQKTSRVKIGHEPTLDAEEMHKGGALKAASGRFGKVLDGRATLAPKGSGPFSPDALAQDEGFTAFFGDKDKGLGSIKPPQGGKENPFTTDGLTNFFGDNAAPKKKNFDPRVTQLPDSDNDLKGLFDEEPPVEPEPPEDDFFGGGDFFGLDSQEEPAPSSLGLAGLDDAPPSVDPPAFEPASADSMERVTGMLDAIDAPMNQRNDESGFSPNMMPEISAAASLMSGGSSSSSAGAGPNPNDISFLGDRERANQFAYDSTMGADEYETGGYFDPNSDSRAPDPSEDERGSGSGMTDEVDEGGTMRNFVPAGLDDFDPSSIELDDGKGPGRTPDGRFVSNPGGSGGGSANSSPKQSNFDHSSLDGASSIEVATDEHNPFDRQPTPSPSAPARSAAATTGTGHFVKATPVAEMVVEGQGSFLQGLANVFLIIILVCVGFLGFVAWNNQGTLDFKNLGDQVKFAFGQAEAKAPPKPQNTPPKKEQPIKVENLEQVTFPNKEGKSLFVVEGAVVNRGTDTYRGITVEGTVFDKDGKAVATQKAPIGRALSEEELLGVLDAKALEETYTNILSEVSKLKVGPKQAARFSLVFPTIDGDDGAKRTFKIKIGSFDKDSSAPPQDQPDKEEKLEDKPEDDKPKEPSEGDTVDEKPEDDKAKGNKGRAKGKRRGKGQPRNN